MFNIFVYKKFKSVVIITLSCNFTIGRILGGIMGKYLKSNHFGSLFVCLK